MPLRQFTCLQCNSVFVSTGTKPARYCSKKCRSLSYRTEKQCAQCGLLFLSRHTGVRFCGIKCAGIANTLPDRHCPQCGKLFHPAHAKVKHCSYECRNQSYRKYDLRPCLQCGKLFDPWFHVAKYCSKKCTDQANRTERTCLICGCRFVVPNARLKATNGGSFCSKNCSGSNASRQQRRISKWEQLFFDQLEAAGLRLDRQVRIRHFTVDAICRDTNVAIEFDGVYWHSFPKCKARDGRKSDAIAWAGYKLIRVPDMEWKNDQAGTIARVLEAVWKL